MAQYCFPAVFTLDDDVYHVRFPDMENCITFGDSLIEAVLMAQDALALVLTFMEDNGLEIPEARAIHDIHCTENAFPSLIVADTAAYRRLIDQLDLS